MCFHISTGWCLDIRSVNKICTFMVSFTYRSDHLHVQIDFLFILHFIADMPSKPTFSKVNLLIWFVPLTSWVNTADCKALRGFIGGRFDCVWKWLWSHLSMWALGGHGGHGGVFRLPATGTHHVSKLPLPSAWISSALVKWDGTGTLLLQHHGLLFTFTAPLELTKPDVPPASGAQLCMSPRTRVCSELWGAVGGSSLAAHRYPEAVLGAPHLVGDEVVAQGVQAAGDVGEAHRRLDKQADPGLAAAVFNHPLTHLDMCGGSHVEDRGALAGHSASSYSNTRGVQLVFGLFEDHLFLPGQRQGLAWISFY